MEGAIHVRHQVGDALVGRRGGSIHRNRDGLATVDAHLEHGVPGEPAHQGGRVLACLEDQAPVHTLRRLGRLKTQLAHRRVRGLCRESKGRNRRRDRRQFEALAILAGPNLGAEPGRGESRVHIGGEVIHGQVAVRAGL